LILADRGGRGASKTEGIVVKGVGGLYHVRAPGGELYFCRARGIFRNERISPLPGDRVEIYVIDEAGRAGDLYAILPRRNVLARPRAANVDAAVIVMAAALPALNPDLLDRFLLLNERAGIGQAICVNKCDLPGPAPEFVRKAYAAAGYPVFEVSAALKTGLEAFSEFLSGKVCVLAGPSGVGKSSLVNALCPGKNRETGELSAKIGRGRHTTRETALIELFPGAYVMDTPGFTSLDISGVSADELPGLFPEFRPFIGRCRFTDCAHDREDGCAVKDAVGGAVSEARYKRYIAFREETAACRERF